MEYKPHKIRLRVDNDKGEFVIKAMFVTDDELKALEKRKNVTEGKYTITQIFND